MVDVSYLINPVSDETPHGEDLEYDADFLELERLAQGQPERQMGQSVIAAEPPDWRQVRERAGDLFARSKDLRLASLYLQSAIALDGLNGLAQGLTLVRELLTQYWEGVYPQLDADDDNDPTIRINALNALSAEPVIVLLREASITRSRAFGAVSIRAALNAADLQRFASETLSPEQLRGAFLDTDAELLDSTRVALDEAAAALADIEGLLSERVGSAQSANLESLKQVLRHTRQIFNDQAPAGDDASYSEETPAYSDAGDDASNAPPAARQAPAAPGRIASRDDVLRTLDRLLEYYAQHEPSSPVPVLLTRAQKLVTADFAEIVRNLIPDGMSQFENLRGPEYD
ncbi:type VI secretion system protein TssA [Pseudomonas sp. PA27(2017)]|uniref:type VI secretion system protein TssA n=1 Tax=Pseudomonas sp. PA27(2017) TaxID=1932112 RepID=UPI000965CF54|nr:type VI secretion system protein TssA [Pseudomonas sp. PA27(2017)]OLU23972.1 type VI secretion protein ImpA [Pseudomonas sp. PA27(2017)]